METGPSARVQWKSLEDLVEGGCVVSPRVTALSRSSRLFIQVLLRGSGSDLTNRWAVGALQRGPCTQFLGAEPCRYLPR